MKVFNQKQLQAWDEATKEQFNIRDINMIQGAAMLLAHELEPFVLGTFTTSVHIFCGMGHNGADGLAVAKLLSSTVHDLHIYQIKHKTKVSPTYSQLLKDCFDLKITIHEITDVSQLKSLSEGSLIIDALLGIGISRELDGLMEEVVAYLNLQVSDKKISIDYPTGLHPDKTWESSTFMADITLSIASLKLSSFFHENDKYIGQLIHVTLPLSDEYLDRTNSNHETIELLDKTLLPIMFDTKAHKNDFGHVLVVGGSLGKMGAALLASEAAFRAGCGLVTAHVPSKGVTIMQVGLREAMVSVDPNDDAVSQLPLLDPFDVVCIGCGMDKSLSTNEFEKLRLHQSTQKVIDADGLNILAQHPELMTQLDESYVLTPHVGEFDRMFGSSKNSFERYQKLMAKANNLGCFIILKGFHTMIATPNGKCFINTTGNITLAIAGSGDVLAGYLAGMLAQGYDMTTACKRAVCYHGYAGDLLLESFGPRGAKASDILDKLASIEVEIEYLMDDYIDDMIDVDIMDEDDPLGLDFLENPN